MKAKFVNNAVIAVAGLALCFPVLIYGFPFYTRDGVFHVVCNKYFSAQLWDGDLYPRWLVEVNGGLGSPVFFYHPPLAHYLSGALFHFFSNHQHGWFQRGASATLVLVASGFCAFLWLRSLTSNNSALIAAVLYMAMPYLVDNEARRQ